MSGLDFCFADRFWPVHVVAVIECGKSFARAFDVEAFLPIVPSAKQMSFCRDEVDRVTEPPRNCGVENRHGYASPAILAADHAVNEQVLRLGEVNIADTIFVVMDATILLQNLNHHRRTQVCFRVSIMFGKAWIVSAVEMALGLDTYLFCPLVESPQTPMDVELLRAWQSFGAAKIHHGDVLPLQFVTQ